LITTTITPLGEMTLANSDKKALGYDVREGYAEEVTRIFADQHGIVLRIEAGDVTLALTPKDEIEKRFAMPRAAAEKLIAAAQPPPEPPAAPPAKAPERKKK
jgi:hypothetical protein